MAPINGTANNDYLLTGTPDPDTITGLDGNDFIAGGGVLQVTEQKTGIRDYL